MNIDVIRQALRHYIDNVPCTNSTLQRMCDALKEANESAERYSLEHREGFQHKAVIVPMPAFIDLMTLATYNEFSKIAYAHDGFVPFDTYMHQVRNNLSAGLDLLTDRQLEIACNYLIGLWVENEANGNHNCDGTLKD